VFENDAAKVLFATLLIVPDTDLIMFNTQLYWVPYIGDTVQHRSKEQLFDPVQQLLSEQLFEPKQQGLYTPG